MIIYYSGDTGRVNPEIVLLDQANIMATYNDFHRKKEKNKWRRWKRIVKARKKGRATK